MSSSSNSSIGLLLSQERPRSGPRFCIAFENLTRGQTNHFTDMIADRVPRNETAPSGRQTPERGKGLQLASARLLLRLHPLAPRGGVLLALGLVVALAGAEFLARHGAQRQSGGAPNDLLLVRVFHHIDEDRNQVLGIVAHGRADRGGTNEFRVIVVQVSLERV